MISDKKAREIEFLAGLGSFLCPLGFFGPHEQSFTRPFAGGQSVVHITFIRYTQSVDATIDVAVRHDNVESVASMDLSPRDRNRACTIGAELGNISCGRQLRWELVGKMGVAEQAATAVLAIGMPFFDKFAHLDQVLRVLEGHDAESSLYSPIAWVRAKRACVVASLICPERLLDIINSKRDTLAKGDSASLRMFEEFLGRWRNK